MRRALQITASALGLLAILLSVRCFSPDLPDCSFRCGPSAPMCPDEYECRPDGYCHKKGTTSMCHFTPPDLLPPQDLSGSRDLSGADMAPADAAGSDGMDAGD